VPKCRYRPAIAGDERLLQLALPPRVSVRHRTSNVRVSTQVAAPAPSTTYARSPATAGVVKTASPKGIAARSPGADSTRRPGAWPERRESNLDWGHSSWGAARADARHAAIGMPLIRRPRAKL
jgi:hypothetical protein